VARIAFQIAQKRRKKLTSVDKANVLEVSQLWRATVNEVAAEFPDVTLEHQLVDSMAMLIVTNPRNYDVVLTENLFGDILSDESAVITGSLGMLPSATIGGKVNLYEPIHGSEPSLPAHWSCAIAPVLKRRPSPLKRPHAKCSKPATAPQISPEATPPTSKFFRQPRWASKFARP
jgi:hypothetical protein